MFKALGAVLLVVGVLYSVWAALGRRKLTQPPKPSSDNESAPSLEPRDQGMKFLGLSQNLPALILIIIGGALLLYAD
jgi:hypothetical protein